MQRKECLDIVVRIRAAVRSYLWIACIACGASYTFAAPGDPDLSFNGTGSFGPFSFTSGATNPRAMTLQPDGKIVVAGHCEFSSTITNTDFCVLRLNRDGTVDTTFTGPSGTAQGFFTVSLGYSVERLSAVRLQSDGKIVLAGTCGSSGTTGVFCVARLNPNGSLDDTFDGPGGFGNGSFAISFGSGPGGDELIDMAIQPDDKIVVAGTCRPSTFPQFCVARLNGNNGSFDASFDGPNGGGNGRFTQSIVSTSTNEFLGALAIQANGAIVLGGGCGNETCMMRLVGSTGAFDPSFDGPSSPAGNGRWSENIGSNADQVRGIVEVLADGTTNPHLMIAFSNVTVIPPEYAVALLTSSGDLSPALTGSDALDGSAVRNVLELPIGGATRWIERANSRLVLAIGALSPNPVLARFTPGFGPGWGLDRSRFKVFTSGFVSIKALLQQPDGRVLVLGTAASDTVLVSRLQGGPYPCYGDYDGDERVLATVDSLIGTRLALGIEGPAVIGGISFPAGATRTTWPAIRDYLIESCGLPLTQ